MRRIAKSRRTGKILAYLKNIQDKLAQRDRKHRDKYTVENQRHLEGVKTITSFLPRLWTYTPFGFG